MEARPEIITNRSESSAVMRNRRIGLLAIKAIVGAVLMYFVLQMVDTGELWRSLEKADPIHIGIATLLLGLNLGTRTLKWKMMLLAAGNSVSTRTAMVSIVLGITFGSFTPGQIGEVGGRFLGVEKGKLAHVVGLTMLDRSQVFLVLAMSGLTSYAFLLLQPVSVAVLASILSVSVCLFLYMRLEFIQTIVGKLPFRFVRLDWFEDFIETFSLLPKRELLQSLLYSLAFNVVLFLQMFFFLNAFGDVDPWTTFLGFSAMMFFKSLLPISLGDIGVREASTVYFFSMLGVSNVVALSATLLMFGVNLILPSLVGIFFLPSTKLHKPAKVESEK